MNVPPRRRACPVPWMPLRSNDPLVDTLGPLSPSRTGRTGARFRTLRRGWLPAGWIAECGASHAQAEPPGPPGELIC